MCFATAEEYSEFSVCLGFFVLLIYTQVLLCEDPLTSVVLSACFFCWVFSRGLTGNISELVICRNFQAIFIPGLAASSLCFSGMSFPLTVFALLLNFDFKK